MNVKIKKEYIDSTNNLLRYVSAKCNMENVVIDENTIFVIKEGFDTNNYVHCIENEELNISYIVPTDRLVAMC